MRTNSEEAVEMQERLERKRALREAKKSKKEQVINVNN